MAIEQNKFDPNPPALLGYTIGNGQDVISTGIAGWIVAPFACTIQGVELTANESGSIVVDIWKDSYDNYPPTDADSITASAVPTISSATKSKDTTLSGWTKSLAKGDYLYFNVDSVATIKGCFIALPVLKD